MKAIPVITKITTHNKSLIVIPKKIMEHYQIINNEILQVQFGTKKVEAQVKSGKKEEVYLTSSLNEQLLLPFSGNGYLKYTDKTFNIGPLIGILTTGFTGNLQKPFGERSNFFQFLLTEGLEKTAYYFIFTPSLINWEEKTINGLFWQKEGWHLLTVPIPEVVYNRIPNRTIEGSEEVIRTKLFLKSIGSRLFNPGFFNKWDIFQLLKNYPQVAVYLPETILAPTAADVNELLKEHDLLYLKPIHGSLGLGIYRIFKQNNNIIIENRLNERLIKRSFKQLTNTTFNKIFHNLNLQKYILQQGIKLAKYNNNPYDFRIHLHKNKKNKWNVVAIAGKVAGSDAVTTHIRTGGNIVPTETLLIQSFGEKGNLIINDLELAAVQIAEVVEYTIKEDVGELGLDVGVDEDQKIWLFEVNSKPGRSIFKHPNFKQAGKISAKQIIDYSIYLANLS